VAVSVPAVGTPSTEGVEMSKALGGIFELSTALVSSLTVVVTDQGVKPVAAVSRTVTE
jgi:hypothetical protein